MMMPYSPQKIVNLDLIKIEKLFVMDLCGTPNLNKIFSFRKMINCFESTFLRETSYHLVN
jgi:hypothetical protein